MRNIGVDMLNMAIFCLAIENVLADFCDGEWHPDFRMRVRCAIEFLNSFPERPKKTFRFSDMPTYGFKGEKSQITYEQLVALEMYFKSHMKLLLETKKKLPLVISSKTDMKKRREAAGYCAKLFKSLNAKFLWYFEFPPNFGISEETLELLCKSERRKK